MICSDRATGIRPTPNETFARFPYKLWEQLGAKTTVSGRQIVARGFCHVVCHKQVQQLVMGCLLNRLD